MGKFKAIEDEVRNANIASTNANEKVKKSLAMYEDSLKAVQKASDGVDEAKAQLDNAEDGTEAFIVAERKYNELLGHQKSAVGNKTKLTIAKEMDEANAEEASIRVDELKNDKVSIKEDLDEVQNDYDVAAKELQDMKAKGDAIRLSAYKGLKHEVRVDGAPGPVLMALDDAAKIRALAKVESQARKDFLKKQGLVASVTHISKGIKHKAIVAGAAMSVESRRNASHVVSHLASNIAPLTEKIDVLSKKTQETEDESVQLGKAAHIHLMKMDVLERVKHTVKLRIAAAKKFVGKLEDKTKYARYLNEVKLDADKLIARYQAESSADEGYSVNARTALYLADRATHFSIEANVAVVRAKNHHKESFMRVDIAKKACDKFRSSKLTDFENWLTSGEHSDEEANVAAMASVKEARTMAQASNELEVEAHRAIAAQQRSAREVQELEKMATDVARRADMDCKKADDDEVALEQQKQVSDGDSFLAGLEAAKVQAERDARRTRKQCKKMRREQLLLSKRTKAATEKHIKLTGEAEEAEARAHAKRAETDKVVKDAMDKTKYANRRAHQETAAFVKARNATCTRYHQLIEHVDDSEKAIAAVQKSADLLHKRAQASRQNATMKFEMARKHHQLVARLKKDVDASYLKTISTYKTWREYVKQLVIAKDNLFWARRKEMDATKNLPLRVRQNIQKAYDMQMDRSNEALKSLKVHSDAVVADGVAAEKLRDTALKADNKTLTLRRGIRKMEEQQAKRTEYMLNTIIKNSKSLKADFKRAVPPSTQDDPAGSSITGMSGTTGTTGMAGLTGMTSISGATGVDNTGTTGTGGMTGASTAATGITGPALDDDVSDLTPAEKEAEHEMEVAADKKPSSLQTESQMENEVEAEVREAKEVGIKKSPLAHWLGGDALTDKHGCVVAAGDAWCSATKNCYSVSEPDTCPSALSTANVIREIYVADCPWCKKAKNESGKPKKLLFPGELEEARSTVDKHVLEWSKIVSHAQASAEALYSKSNETLDRLEVAVAHSNEMFTSEHAHQHLEHFMKRLESQAFNVSKAVKDVIAKRIASSKKAMLLKTKFIKEHSFANDTVMDNSTNGGTGGATGGTGGATGGAAHKGALAHDSVAAFKV